MIVSAAAGGEDEEGDAGKAELTLAERASFMVEITRVLELLRPAVFSASPLSASLSVCALVDRYQEAAELLDPHLERIVTAVFDSLLPLLSDPRSAFSSVLLHRLLSVLYSLAKVRGHKTVVSFFPHAVWQLEPALQLLVLQPSEARETWTTPFSLLLWLSILVRLPFDLRSLDSGQQEAEAGGSSGVVSQLVSVGRLYLQDSGPSRDMAALLLSRLLSRPDTQRHLAQHISWSLSCLQPAASSSPSSASSSASSSFLHCGLLRSLVDVCKTGERECLLPHLPQLLRFFLSSSFSSLLESGRSVLLRKLSVKLQQRLGLLLLGPTSVPAWRYSRGCRSVIDNLHSIAHRLSGSAQPEAAPAAVPPPPPASADAALPPVAAEVELMIEALLSGLCDRDTVVRWSAAKGIGRLTACLSAADGDDVVGSVLQLLTDCRESDDSSMHGGCLAVAELSRRGLLLPARLAAVVPLTVRALHFDVRSASHSVGANVRDAACYCVWAFARAYEPRVIRPHAAALARSLLLLAVYDREVNVRRAACAAYQESVGRQGGGAEAAGGSADSAAVFPHGIALNTIADYFTVSVRSQSFLSVGQRVAAFSEYTAACMQHLVLVKCRHWDRDIRELAAAALAGLAELSESVRATLRDEQLPVLYSGCCSDDMGERHGCTLAVASCVIALHRLQSPLSIEQQRRLLQLVLELHSRQLFSTRRSPLLRLSLSRLLLAVSAFSPPLPSFPRLLSMLEENLQQEEEEVQRSTVEALCPYWSRPEMSADMRAALVSRWSTECTAALPAARRGFCLALGSLPPSVLTGDLLAAIVQTLTQQTRPAVQDDAETRRNALLALSRVCLALDDRLTEASCPSADGDQRRVCDALLAACVAALDDYAADNRGDVGSWVREAAMRSGEAVLAALAATGQEAAAAQPQLVSAFVCGLLKQAVEKIDRVRDCAGRTLQRLLSLSPPVQHLPQLQELQRALLSPSSLAVDWSAPAASFPLLCPLLFVPCFTFSLLSGLVLAVGGLSESVVRQSSSALLQQLSEANGEQRQTVALQLVRVLKSGRGQARVVVPALRTAELLLSSGALSALPSAAAASAFAVQLCERCEKEAEGSSNVHKLIAVCALLSQLLLYQHQPQPQHEQQLQAALPLPSPPLWRRRALSQLLSLLHHRFPKVRRLAAESLYAALLQQGDDARLMQEVVTGDDWQERVDDALSILSSTAWDTGSALSIQARLSQLSHRLQLSLSQHHDQETGGSTRQPQAQPQHQQEPLHYAALVNSAGY